MNTKADTRGRSHAFRGCFKLKPGEKSVPQELLEDRAREKQHDEEEYRQWDRRLRRRGIR